MLREREHGHADVAEDEVLGEEVQQLKEVLRPRPGIVREVVVRVVGLADAAKQDRDDTWNASDEG